MSIEFKKDESNLYHKSYERTEWTMELGVQGGTVNPTGALGHSPKNFKNFSFENHRTSNFDTILFESTISQN